MRTRVGVGRPRATRSEHHTPTRFPGNGAVLQAEGQETRGEGSSRLLYPSPHWLLLLMPQHLFLSLLLLSVRPTASSLHVHSHLGLGFPPRLLSKDPSCLSVLALLDRGFLAHCPWGRGQGSWRTQGGARWRPQGGESGEASQPPLADSGREAPPPPARLSPPLPPPPKNAAQFCFGLSFFALPRVLGPDINLQSLQLPYTAGIRNQLVASRVVSRYLS